MSKGKKRNFSLPFGVKTPQEQAKLAKKGITPVKPKRPPIVKLDFDKGWLPNGYDIPPRDYRMSHMIKEAIKILGDKYPRCRIQVYEHIGYDATDFRCGRWQGRINNSFLASSHPLEIAQEIENLLHLKEYDDVPPRPPHPYYTETGTWDVKKIKELIESTPSTSVKVDNRTEAEKWADDWIKNGEAKSGI